MPVRVLTYNVHGWLTADGQPNVELVGDVLAAVAPDIVGLNEVFHTPADPAGAALDVLAARLGMHYAFAATQPTDPDKHPPYGNALLSRWPVLAHAAHHLAPVVSYGKRGMLECRIALPSGLPLTVYVTHLDHRREQIRLEQWAAANTWLLRDRARPHLLMGDFNALAGSDYPDEASVAHLAEYQAEQGWPTPSFELVAQILKAGYIDSYAAAGHRAHSGSTFPTQMPERRIDYIFLPGPLRGALRSCTPYSESSIGAASDHLPVLAEIHV
jgi:endonuclease/exonuclease/phosphatase family metal-dependent hydrolase